MANQVNVKLDIGHEASRVKIPLTLDRVIFYIRQQGFDEYTTNGLIKLASNTPSGALGSFRKNFNLMINRVRAQRKKELGGEIEEAAEQESPSEVPIEISQRQVQDPAEENKGAVHFQEESDPDLVERV
jgi:hypothetical protein